MHCLSFGEPCTGIQAKDTLEVNREMYQLILKGATVIREPNGEEVGYVFGPLYSKNQYQFVTSHGNDVAQTGIIELEQKTDKWKDSYRDLKIWDYDREENPKENPKGNPKENPEILWLGETFGGDVGASYYAHYNEACEVDSLVVSIRWIEDDLQPFEGLSSITMCGKEGSWIKKETSWIDQEELDKIREDIAKSGKKTRLVEMEIARDGEYYLMPTSIKVSVFEAEDMIEKLYPLSNDEYLELIDEFISDYMQPFRNKVSEDMVIIRLERRPASTKMLRKIVTTFSDKFMNN